VGLREVYGVSVSAAFPYRLRELRRLKQREVQVDAKFVLSSLLGLRHGVSCGFGGGFKSSCVLPPRYGRFSGPGVLAAAFTASSTICVSPAASLGRLPPFCTCRQRRPGVPRRIGQTAFRAQVSTGDFNFNRATRQPPEQPPAPPVQSNHLSCLPAPLRR